MHPKGTFCPAVGRPGEHPPGRKVLRTGCEGIKTIWFHMGPYGTEEETEGEADTEPEERRRIETEPQNAD